MSAQKSRLKLGASIAEFGPALFVFFFIVLFPLINLIAMATGACTVYLATKLCATKAAEQTSFGDALIAAEEAAYNMEQGGFGKFAKLYPIGGYNNSGMDLYVIETNINTNVSYRHGPNTPFVARPIQTDENLYSYEAVCTYDIGPFMNLHSVPFIGNVPGVGVPATLSYTASMNVEHPEGLPQGVGGRVTPPRRRGGGGGGHTNVGGRI